MKMPPWCTRLLTVSILMLGISLVASCAAFRGQPDPISNRIDSLKHQEEQSYQAAQREKQILATDRPAPPALNEGNSVSISGGIDLKSQEPSRSVGPNTSGNATPDRGVDARQNTQIARSQTPLAPTISPKKDGPTQDAVLPRGGQTVLRVTPAEQTIAIGQELSLRVEVQNVSDLHSSPFYLLFDPKLFEFVDLQEGEFLKRDGKSTAFLKAVDSTEGRIIVGLSRLGKVGGMSGSGVLLTATFRAKQTGSGSFSVQQAKFVNSALSPLPVVSQQGVIRVKG